MRLVSNAEQLSVWRSGEYVRQRLIFIDGLALLRLRCLLLSLVLCCGFVEAHADQALTPYVAEYKVKISVLSGKLATELRRTEFGYFAVSTIRPAGIANVFMNGLIEESSWFSVSSNGVVPDRYSSVDTITKDQKAMDFRFDWLENEVAGTIGDQNYVIPLDGRVHDRVSIQFELMLKLLSGSPADRYVMLNEEELRPIVVSNIGKKRVKVPFGSFDVVGIQHRTEDSSRLTTLWCAEKLGYLPVIIEQHKNGKLRVRAVLDEYVPLVETATATVQ
jgi:hypothetical protein